MDEPEVVEALKRLTRGLGVFGPDLVRALQRELSALRRCWSISLPADDEEALMMARQAVSGNLHILIDQLEPRKAHQNLTPEQREKQYKTVVRVLFNVPPRKTDPEYSFYASLMKMDLTRRRNWLAKEAPPGNRIKVSPGQDDLAHAIKGMALRIVDAGYMPLAGGLNEMPELGGGEPQPSWVADFNAQYGPTRSEKTLANRSCSMIATARNGWTLVTLDGEADVFNTQFIRNGLIELYRLGKIGRLIIGLDGLYMMESTFIGVLYGQLKRSQANGGALRLAGGNASIVYGLRRTGLKGPTLWFPDVESAVTTPLTDDEWGEGMQP
jgi:anti-anti-sigma factor